MGPLFPCCCQAQWDEHEKILELDMRPIMTYKKIITKIARICSILGAISLILLSLLTVCDVLLRYFFNRPIVGSYELTEYLLIPIVFFSIPWTTKEKSNVRVDLIVGRFRANRRAIIYTIACVLSIIVTSVFAWFTVPQAIYIGKSNIHSEMLKIPAYPFYIITALGFFILFFILIDNLIDFIKEAAAK
jgi:TRAP-type C4-dicarboxylate transport system permease small subunit